MRSPGVSDEGHALLEQRGTLPVVDGKHACHSELTADSEVARAVQAEALRPVE
jgi:hypothetical protein